MAAADAAVMSKAVDRTERAARKLRKVFRGWFMFAFPVRGRNQRLIAGAMDSVLLYTLDAGDARTRASNAGARTHREARNTMVQNDNRLISKWK